jgi:glycosyltransferase involved in cell wall biosynthesis
VSRVLFVTPQFPEEPSRSISGAFRRMRMWLDAIASMGAELELLIFTPVRADASPGNAARVSRALADEWGLACKVELCPIAQPAGGGPLANYLRPMFSLAGHTEFGRFGGARQAGALAAGLSRSPDIVFFHTLYGATAGWSRPAGARVYLDLPDIEHRRFLREIPQPPRGRLKPLRRLWVPSLWWGERVRIVRSDRTFVCSDIDRDYLRRAMGVTNVSVIPNAAARVEDRPASAEPNILFLGTYDYPPNRVAAEHLVRDVWPHLSRLRPEARLLIAGPCPEQIAGYRTPPAGVEYLGFVPDLEALYARTSVFCCPIRSGGGTRVKILEAASHGVPVVSTPIGAEGIDLEPGREIVLREGPEALAAGCAELLADPGRARSIGTLGRDRVRERYGRDAVVARMRAMLGGEAPPPVD